MSFFGALVGTAGGWENPGGTSGRGKGLIENNRAAGAFCKTREKKDKTLKLQKPVV